MKMGITRANELYSHKGRPGRLGVAKTKFFEDFVFHPDRPDEGEYLPGTNVPRLKPVSLGEKAIGFFDDEVDQLIEALRRERDKQPRRAELTAPRSRVEQQRHR